MNRNWLKHCVLQEEMLKYRNVAMSVGKDTSLGGVTAGLTSTTSSQMFPLPTSIIIAIAMIVAGYLLGKLIWDVFVLLIRRNPEQTFLNLQKTFHWRYPKVSTAKWYTQKFKKNNKAKQKNTDCKRYPHFKWIILMSSKEV